MGEISYNIIDSVKGGSGKTSLSLMLAMAAQHSLNEDAKEKGKDSAVQTLVLDMDMQGSALAEMLYGKTREGMDGRAEQFLDQRILSYYCKGSKKFISYPIFKLFKSDGEQPENTVKIGVAMASPKLEDRMAFRASSRQNYSSQITYTAFTAGLREVLHGLDTVCSAPPRYVFFDMPPNSNGYSDAVLELLLQKEEGLWPGKGNCCNYFALTTLDRGHIKATLNWFEHFVNEKYSSFPDRFFFTFSNVPSEIAEMRRENGHVNEAVRVIKDRVDSILKSTNQSYGSRIYFAGIGYQADYLRTCCSVDALGAADSPETKGVRLTSDMLAPVSFLLPLSTTVDSGSPEMDTEELIRLITPGGGTEGAK